MRFFLGSNTPRGFYSYFQRAYDIKDGWRVWIIKGGAGTGKSGMMKKIANAAQEITETERVFCSSDPDSLDAVILPEKKKMILDGTAPHVVEPKLVGACENIVNVGAFWDSDYLFEKAGEIAACNEECSHCHARASRYINAANTFNRDSARMIKPYFDSDSALKMLEREFAFEKISENEGKISYRLISAVTPNGVTFYEEDLSEKCGKVIGFRDDYGAAAPFIISYLAGKAVENGYDITLCPCSMDSEKAEHIIIPALGVSFTTVSRYHAAKCTKVFDIAALVGSTVFGKHREKLAFNSTAADGLFEEASEAMREAKGTHDKLEKIYIDSMDFSRVDALTEELIEKMTK